MRRLWCLGVSLCLLLWGVAVAEPRDPDRYFFDDTFGDFREELERAREEGKRGIFIFFEMEECPFCHYMRQRVLSDPEVQDYYRRNFLNFPLDIEGDIEIVDFQGRETTQKAFALENRVRATPVLAFFDLEGKRVVRYTGRTSGVEEFLLLGRYMAEGHYRTMSFNRFKRSQRRDGR